VCVLFAEAFEISPACTLPKCIRCIRTTTGADREVRIETIYHQILAGRVCGRLPCMLMPISIQGKHSATRIATAPVPLSTTLKSRLFSTFIWRRKQRPSPKHFDLRAGYRKDKFSERNNTHNFAPSTSTDLARAVCSGLRI